MLTYRTPLEVETGDSPTASVIWLHGLGANGFDFLPIVDELVAAHLPPTRFIFPHAAEQPVTLNGGYVMPSWYDIIGLQADAPEDEAGIRASLAYLDRLIEREIQRGIASQRIVLAGFSQGGNIALNSALRYLQPLAGALILSSYLGLKDRLALEASAANRALPIFMAHGTADDIVPYALADGSRVLLTKLGYSVEWHEYAMTHTVSAQEVVDIGNWLANVLTA
ncbi:MAG: alpha/beta hydrolase fold domain-containing protein [Burkholderiales bacterium]|nr:alpha/beta hydrolase fold domain-containing protein [Burkholderiales bacterium]